MKKKFSLIMHSLFIAGSLSVFFSSPLNAENTPVKFHFDLLTDDVLILEKAQNIKISYMAESETKEEKNKIVLHVKEKRDNQSRLTGSFYTYSRTPIGTGNFRQDETFYSDFNISDLGTYTVPDNFVMPNLRSMPSFPDYAVSAGQSWKATAQETMDFGKVKLRIPLSIDYTYSEQKEIKDKDNRKRILDRIDFGYDYSYSLTPEEKRLTGFSRIVAKSKDAVFFERAEGIPLFDRKNIVYIFIMTDGTFRKFEYQIDTKYRKIRHTENQDKALIAAEINKDLKKEDSLSAHESSDGIVLNMDDILFKTGSANLTENAKNTVGKIAEILKKHPEREIRIQGHTDSRGSDEANMTLSENRARAVLNALRDSHGIEQSRLSFKGFGKTNPVAPNTTEEGRSKNRRVEVIIVME
jgi:outer membrane protein OmpA-like peptidoglycan-associated protein